MFDALLAKALEQQRAMARAATIESKDKLVQISLEVFCPHRKQAGQPVHVWERR